LPQGPNTLGCIVATEPTPESNLYSVSAKDPRESATLEVREMKLGTLFSGGKDSVLAAELASECEDVTCLVTLVSKNPNSYMFHTPLIRETALQARSMGLPQVMVETEGEKEEEVLDLEEAFRTAVDIHGIEGIVTGAIHSVYQASRIQRACRKVGLWCFNPLWQRDQLEVLAEVLSRGYRVVISAVAAYPLGEEWLGRVLDHEALGELKDLRDRLAFNPAGEGGEFETFVLEGPLFKIPLRIRNMTKTYRNYSGRVELVLELVEDG